jgi:hypothetical protein
MARSNRCAAEQRALAKALAADAGEAISISVSSRWMKD